MPSGTPGRASWVAGVLEALLFTCLPDDCFYDDDLPIATLSLESPGGTPYLFPALRARGPSGPIAFLAPLGVTLDAFLHTFGK